jgi:hypothetical protein
MKDCLADFSKEEPREGPKKNGKVQKEPIDFNKLRAQKERKEFFLNGEGYFFFHL